MSRFERTCVGIFAMIVLMGTSYAGEVQDAVKNGRIDEIQRMLASDSTMIASIDDAGNTLLHLACQNGQTAIADVLIKAGSDINAANMRGMTPLRWAIQAMNIDLVILLLDHGAKTDDAHPMFGSIMNQAFSTTCQKGADSRLVETLMAHGIRLDAGRVDALGMSPLDWAVHFGNVELARLALEHGADVNLVSQRLGRPPLGNAVAKGNSQLADMFLEHGADVSITDKSGYPPIYYAVEQGRTSILEKLLSHGASTDFSDPHYGRSLLHLATIRGFRDVADILAAYGADINGGDRAGKTPLHYAIKYGNKDVARYLTERGATTSKTADEKLFESADNIAAGKASIWYLNHRGWVVETRDHLLVFDPEEFEVRRSDNPCLANGFLTAQELKHQDVVGLYSCYHGNPGEPAYIHTLADSLDEIAFVHLVDDPWRGSPNTTYLKGNADTSVADIGVQAIDIPSGMPMLAYLCHTGDLTIYYQAFSAGDAAALRQNYEFLKQHVDTVDIAFLPMPEADQQETDVRLFLDQFPTQAVVLVDAERREYLFPDAARQIAQWGYPVKVFCAANPGDRYDY